LARTFRRGERLRADLRGEVFNLPNSPRFAPGSRNLDDPDFGVVRAAINQPRRMQFALKLYF